MTRRGARVHVGMRCALRTAALVALACPTVAQDEGTWRRPPQVDIDRAIDLGAAHLRASWEREHEDRVRRSAGHATSRAGERALAEYLDDLRARALIVRADP